MYSVRLLNRDRQLLAVLNEHAGWRYVRRASEATELSITLPRPAVDAVVPEGMDLYAFLSPTHPVHAGSTIPAPDEKTAYAQIAAFVQVYRGSSLAASGRISKRDIGDQTVTLRCLTEEILLDQHITPAQYGRVLDGQDLADVARALLRGWHTMRVKAQSQWQAAVSSSTVDLTTEPGLVLLAKSSGRYVASGNIVLRFDRAEVPDFHSWDRIRWSSDNGGPVRTTMQYRYGASAGSMGAWSSEIEGALPDEIGVVPGTSDANLIDVRLNLYTDDRDSEDPAGNPVGQTPAVFALEVIARTTGSITAGSIPPSAGVVVNGIEANGVSALTVLRAACAQHGWEFEVIDGELNLAENIGTDRTADFVLRAGTNMRIEGLGDDDAELVNILTAYGPGEGINRMMVTLRDAASIIAYGPYPRPKEFPDATTLTQLQDQAQAWIDAHNVPKTKFRVRTMFPPEEEPPYGYGDTVRVCDPDSGIITTARIDQEAREYAQDGAVTVTLDLNRFAKQLVDLVTAPRRYRNTIAPTKPIIGVTPSIAGITVTDLKPLAKRWAASRCYVSSSPGFALTAVNLRDEGMKTRFDIGDLTPGTRYYTRVVRLDEDGNESPPSDEMSAVAAYMPEGYIDELPITLGTPTWASPALTTAVESVEQVTTANIVATWNAVTGAVWYQLRWRRGTGDWSYTQVVGTSQKIVPLVGNTSYGVQVRAVKRDAASDWSTEETILTAKDTTAPATPSAPTVASVVRGITVRVSTPNTEPDLAGYRVHISTTSGFTPGSGTLVDTLPARPGERVTGEYLDRVPGTTYYVKLEAVDTSGNISAPSAQGSEAAGKLQTDDMATSAVTLHGATGIFTNSINPSSSWADLANMSINLTLDAPATVLVLGAVETYGEMGIRVVVNDAVASPEYYFTRNYIHVAGQQTEGYGTNTVIGIALNVPAGTRNVKLQSIKYPDGLVRNRQMMAIGFKR